jgi:hypothetical protein
MPPLISLPFVFYPFFANGKSTLIEENNSQIDTFHGRKSAIFAKMIKYL